MNSTAFWRNRDQVENQVVWKTSCLPHNLEAADQVESQVVWETKLSTTQPGGCGPGGKSGGSADRLSQLLHGHRFSDRPDRKPWVREPFSKASEDLLHMLHKGFWEASFAVVEYQELLEQLHGFLAMPRHFLYAGSV